MYFKLFCTHYDSSGQGALKGLCVSYKLPFNGGNPLPPLASLLHLPPHAFLKACKNWNTASNVELTLRTVPMLMTVLFCSCKSISTCVRSNEDARVTASVVSSRRFPAERYVRNAGSSLLRTKDSKDRTPGIRMQFMRSKRRKTTLPYASHAAKRSRTSTPKVSHFV